MNSARSVLVLALVLASRVVTVAQETTRVSVDSSGNEGDSDSLGPPSISADGRVVAFPSHATNLVAGDNNWSMDVFVHDRTTGSTERVSVDSSGAEGNNSSGSVSISADGQVVAFSSYASNLVAGDNNGQVDVFVHDRATGITERVSVDSSGVEGNDDSDYPSISADGQVVAFWSMATNLVAGDTNASNDVFVHDRATGITERMSVDSSGVQGNDFSFYPPSISADGQVVAFCSDASNLVPSDKNATSDIFVHDRATGITDRMSVDSSGRQGNLTSVYPSISADGQVVAFYSAATNLVAGDTNRTSDVFVHDRASGITERMSVDSSGTQGNRNSFVASISADGQIVAFESWASNLVAGDKNGFYDIFVHDRSTGITERVNLNSSGAEGNANTFDPSISADGLIVASWSTASNLVAGDTNGYADVFVHEACFTDATWTNFGTGFPGTNGIPAFTSQQNPSFGTTVTLDLANSYGAPTTGLLVVGSQRGSFFTTSGAELLVVPTWIEPITLSYGAVSVTGTIPDDFELCGVPFDLQGIETDPGAAGGFSFSPGLELVVGN
jgi:WD40 repeat protein